MWRKMLVGLSLSTVILAGCQEEGAIEKTKPKEKDNDFTILIGKSDGIDLQEVETSLEGTFGINVEIKKLSDEKKRRMILEGEGDIALVSPREIGFLKDQGTLQKVTVETNNYLPSAIQSLKYEGEQYGIPASFEVPVVAYNPTVFEVAPQEMEDLLSTAITKGREIVEPKEEAVQVDENEEQTSNSLIKQDIEQPYAFYANMQQYENIESVLYAYGFEPFKQKKGNWNTQMVYTDTAGTRKALETIANLHNELIPNFSIGDKKIVEMYDEGNVYAFLIEPNMLEDIQTDVMVTTFPSLNEGVLWQPAIEVKGWAVMESVENKEIIRAFEELVSSESFVRQQIEEGYYTAVKLDWEEENEITKTIYSQGSKSYGKPILAEWEELKTPIKNATEWYLEGHLEAKEALQAAKQTIEFQIQSNYVKK